MKTAMTIIFTLAVAICHAELGIHAVTRTLMDEDASSVTYKDRMSDGTYRDSRVLKPKMPEYPVRTTLVETNDTDRFFELVYESVYAGGRKSTNHTAVLKSKRDIIRDRLTLPPMPQEVTNAPARSDAFALTKNRVLGKPVIVTNKIMRMGAVQPRVLDSKIVNGEVHQRMTDGTTRVEPLRRAFTARVTTEKPREVPEPEGESQLFLLGFAAGAAAAGGVVAAKKQALKK